MLTLAATEKALSDPSAVGLIYDNWLPGSVFPAALPLLRGDGGRALFLDSQPPVALSPHKTQAASLFVIVSFTEVSSIPESLPWAAGMSPRPLSAVHDLETARLCFLFPPAPSLRPKAINKPPTRAILNISWSRTQGNITRDHKVRLGGCDFFSSEILVLKKINK